MCSAVLYAIIKVSFGTHFWPPIPEYIEEVVSAFIEKKVPFVSNLYNIHQVTLRLSLSSDLRSAFSISEYFRRAL